MRKISVIIFALLSMVPFCFAEAVPEKQPEGLDSFRINWEYKPVQYKHFTDVGKYVLMMDVDYSDMDRAIEIVNSTQAANAPSCTATCKRNSKGEVILGRNMDVEISQTPAVVSMIHGGKYKTISFTYGGIGAKYRYDQLEQFDADEDYLKKVTYCATDAMNETGLYIEINMRETDTEMDYSCPGIFPGKPQASVMSLPTLAALHCSTVQEVLDYVRNSYNWYVGSFQMGEKTCVWNLAFMIGDAQGNYGLLETGRNGFYYTPYANGQGNYYIHPELAEYSDYGSGYGRFAAALEGLTECETEWDMLHNMESCMWRKEILDPGCLGYSDVEHSLKVRRESTQEELQNLIDEYMAPYQEMAREFYKGNEKPLREDGSVWTTSFNFGVNCATKHLILRLWENDGAVLEYQW